MIRFRNPGTQLTTQINAFKNLYRELRGLKYFGLTEIANVIARSNLMTAYGYGGDIAIELSDAAENQSKNSAMMNAKMYAEVFRMLGWITPYSKAKSYPVSFTFIGQHIATAEDYSPRLVEQCILGINSPNELSDKMSYNEEVRFFKCALNTFIDLGGLMYKHELSLGPMSVNDTNEKEYYDMIALIKSIRGDIKKLKHSFANLAASLGMKETPVDNCTRIPVAFLKVCRWAESIKTKKLYNKIQDCLMLTEYGRDKIEEVNQMKDLRLREFNKYSDEIQHALIRIGMFGMLERSGYDISNVIESYNADQVLCRDILDGRQLLFSPCQTIRREKIEAALGIEKIDDNLGKEVFSIIRNNTGISRTENTLHIYTIDDEIVFHGIQCEEDTIFFDLYDKAKKNGGTQEEIIERITNECEQFTQTKFYPLISVLFRVMGLDCKYSRPGDNGARWDAIIADDENSIPIEIKSPTEEMHISMKAVRQALENKFILLSRKTFPTKREITSLIVGYLLPNNRAEVSSVINDIYNTYAIKIAVVDLKNLVRIAINVIENKKGIKKEEIKEWMGLINAIV